MSSEYLSINKGGQWELHKATNFNDADNKAPKDVTGDSKDKPYKVFRGASLNGDLHQDFNTRGELHDFNGGTHPKAERINWKNVGKPNHPVDSVYSEHNPGVGND